VIYSKWIPDKGGYAYYETGERRGLGDDLPIPSLTPTSAIGVASTEIGRSLPLGARLVGYGPLAQGSVVPLDRSGLSGIPEGAGKALLLAAVGAASAVAGVFLVRALKNARPGFR